MCDAKLFSFTMPICGFLIRPDTHHYHGGRNIMMNFINAGVGGRGSFHAGTKIVSEILIG